MWSTGVVAVAAVAIAVVDDDDDNDSAAADPSFPSTAERGTSSVDDALVNKAVDVDVDVDIDTAADDAVVARCCVLP